MSDDGPLILKVKRLTPTAKLPTKAHVDDAGFDLHMDTIHFQAGDLIGYGTGLAIEIPTGWYAQIRARSSLARDGIVVLGGVMDCSYRGQWVVMFRWPAPTMIPGSSWPVAVSRGDRIAQFVILPVPRVEIVEVEELGPSRRGAGGFGSTGR